jgi:hypothetical protein
MEEVNLRGSLMAAVVICAGAVAYFAVWQTAIRLWPPAFEPNLGPLVSILVATTLLALSVVVHELLHAVGFWIGAGNRAAIGFGINWAHLTPYAHCAVPMKARAYRFAVTLPGIALGLLPAAIGMITNAGALVAYGTLMLAVAAGDALILQSLRGVPPDAQVRDHPNMAGCQVLM